MPGTTKTVSRKLSSQISGAQGGVTTGSGAAKPPKPPLFMMSQQGGGSGAFGGQQFRPPSQGVGSNFQRNIDGNGFSTPPSFAGDLVNNNPSDAVTERQAFDASIPSSLSGVDNASQSGNVDPASIFGQDSTNNNNPGTEFDNTDQFAGGANDPALDNTVAGSVDPTVFDTIAGLSPDSVDLNAMRSWISDLSAFAEVGSIEEDPNNPGFFIAKDLQGNVIGTNNLGINPADKVISDIQVQDAELRRQRLELDTETQREQNRIQEELGRIDQDIARDRIRADQETALGNWKNALDIQRSIDERERAGRQLERDLFNANQDLQNRKFELDRAGFDLEKLSFFQSLSRSPANFADLFNLSRGLAPTGAGGPLPQGIQRVAAASGVQQTAAQDFRTNGINLGVNAQSGALPQVGGEAALGAQKAGTQTDLSFVGGNDPTPVDSSGNPFQPPPGNVVAGTVGGTETGAGGTGGASFPGFQQGASGAQAQVFDQSGNTGLPPGFDPTQNRQLGPEQTAAVNAAREAALTNASQSGIDAGNQPPQTFGPESLAQGGIAPPLGATDQAASQNTQNITSTGQQVQLGGGGEPTADEVIQGAPLPPGLATAFNGGLPGAPQTLPNSIPILSPQAIAQLTPAEQEVYFALAEMQGQFGPDFQQLVAARGAPQQIAGNRRVFA